MVHKEILLTAVFITVSMHTQWSSRSHKVYPSDWSLWASRFEIHLFPLLQKKESQPYPVRFKLKWFLKSTPSSWYYVKGINWIMSFPKLHTSRNANSVSKTRNCWTSAYSLMPNKVNQVTIGFLMLPCRLQPKFHCSVKGKSCQIHLNRPEMAPGTTWFG